MSQTYTIDRRRRVVLSRAWGVLTRAELLEHYERLRSDPAFDHTYAQLIDVREVTEFALDVDAVRAIAELRLFALGTRRAVVAPTILQAAIARLFAQYAATCGQSVQIFDDDHSALTWLGLDGTAPSIPSGRRPRAET